MSAPHHYADRLHAAIRAKGTPALVGIDPRLDKLPAPVRDAATGPTELDRAADAFERFGKGLVDAVADLVPAVKPQSAFFEEYGPPGMAALSRVIAHARAAGLVVILDAKRGDIGSTAEAYARGLLGGNDPPRAGHGGTPSPSTRFSGRTPSHRSSRWRRSGARACTSSARRRTPAAEPFRR